MQPFRQWFGRLGLLLGLGAVFGWLGPYGTYQELGVAERFAFWMLSLLLIGIPASLAGRMVVQSELGSRWPAWLQGVAVAVVVSVPSTFIAIGVSGLFRLSLPLTARAILQVYASVTVIIALISIPMIMIRAHRTAPAPPVEPPAAAPSPSPAADRPAVPAPAASPPAAGPAAPACSPFLGRIPARLGTELLYIATEDHYLRVVTDRGSDLILFRLADALAELDPAAGQQVHRSYWVARRAVASIERDAHRTALVIANGDRIPVSRTYLPALRDAGWLAI